MHKDFSQVLNEYLDFKKSNQKYASFIPITQTIPSKILAFLNSKGLTFSTKGSNGVGIFSDVPWVTITDPSVTTSAKDGLYIVYIFKADMSGFYLSLNQGTEGKNKQEVRKVSDYIALQIETSSFSKAKINLASNGDRPKKYVNSNIISKYYEKNKFSQIELENDLLEMCNIYQELIMLNNLTNVKYSDFFNQVINVDVVIPEPNVPEEGVNMERNQLYYGVPGCGKSFTVNEEADKILKGKDDNKYRVTFYSDYSYADFVGQIVPVTYDGQLKYEFSPGVFTRALKKSFAIKEEGLSDPVVLIIEEINRGNAPAIFGEIFQLLDRTDNGFSEYPIKNSNIAKALGIDENADIYLPDNFYIFATMNTSDQNVFPLDTAFKRRWSMRYINDVDSNPKYASKIVPNLVDNLNATSSNMTWDEFHRQVNLIIQNQLFGTYNSEDKGIGYFFVKNNEFDNPATFGEKVLQFLWFDVFNLKHNDIFNFSSFRELILCYKKASMKMYGNDQSSLFRESCKPL